jgi:uncharacterized protein YqjF (DUF2071 family)
MSHADLIHHTDHRAWPIPDAPWIMRQTWYNLLFAHWPIAPEIMRALVPPELELDLYDGMAWIAVVPFGMTNVAPRAVPNIPGVSTFLELNVRTYVKMPAPAGSDDRVTKPGVYFFSLDAANALAVFGARTAFMLPYYNADMTMSEEEGDRIAYTSRRTHKDAPPADFVGSYGPIGETYFSQPGTLEHWLTERYCLYTVNEGKSYRAEIHHLPWSLQPARADISVNTMAAAAGITLPDQPPLLHFAKRIDMVNWMLHAVDTND